jgi:hypothetical protein
MTEWEGGQICSVVRVGRRERAVTPSVCVNSFLGSHLIPISVWLLNCKVSQFL